MAEQYYLSISNVVLCSKYTAIEFVQDPEAEFVTTEDDTVNRLTKITVPDINNVTSADIKGNVIKKMYTLEDEKIPLEEGVYLLYRSIVINGFHMVVSDESIDVAINQYVVKAPPIMPAVEKQKDSILIKLNCEMTNEDYAELINNSGLLYVIGIDKDAHLDSIYGVILNRCNKTKLNSHNIIKLTEDHLLIEEADYIASFIKQLEAAYPNVQFYNVDSDLDDSKYNEFFRYKAQMAGFDNSIVTTPVYDDPIYGSVMTTTLQIDFEYHTADLVKFSRRRFDYQINKFLSDNTTGLLKFPNTDRTMSFTAHWDRSVTSDGADDLNIGTSMNEANKGHYRFASNIKMVMTIYRVARSYPEIRKVLLGIPIFLNNNVMKHEWFEATDEHPTFRPSDDLP